MAEHRRSVQTLDEAIDNVEETCEQYRLSIDKALTIAGWEPESIRRILNKITEREQTIISLCKNK